MNTTPGDVLLIFATFPDQEVANRIVRTLVEEELIACGNIIPSVQSIYRWKGAVESSGEALALLKTTATGYPKVQARLAELHPYEVPECIAVPLAAGLPAYLDWVAASTGAPAS